MKKITFASIIAFIIICGNLHAQEKLLSLDDAILKARTTLAPENLSQLQFYGATDDYVYLGSGNAKNVWMRGNYKMKADTAFLNLAQLNRQLSSSGLDTTTS